MAVDHIAKLLEFSAYTIGRALCLAPLNRQNGIVQISRDYLAWAGVSSKNAFVNVPTRPNHHGMIIRTNTLNASTFAHTYNGFHE
jgi:hypothetical protein